MLLNYTNMISIVISKFMLLNGCFSDCSCCLQGW